MGDRTLPARHRRTVVSCRSPFLTAAVLVAAMMSGGCATLTAVASHPVVTGISLISLAVTGKGLADHALDMVTRRDCRILEGLVKEERHLCEQPGSLATLDDFHGVDWFDSNGHEGESGARDIALALDTRLDGGSGNLVAAAEIPAVDTRGLHLALRLSPRPASVPVRAPVNGSSREAVALLQ